MKISDRSIDIGILFIFVVYASCSIIFGAFSSTDGFINPDSAEYLRASERLLSGYGFFVPGTGRLGEAEDVLFAVWPVGYPSLIAIVSLVSGLSTFAASKVLNSILITIAIVALYKKFNRKGLIAASILLTAGTLKIYTMTWAEAAFITSLIILIIYIVNIFENKIKLNFFECLFLLILASLPFFFRYIGLFVMAPLVFFCFYLHFLNRSSDAIKLALITILASLICIVYLYTNLQYTGHKTGMLRIPAPESYSTWFRVLATAIAHEFILFAPNWSPDFAWIPEFAKKGNTIIYLWCVSVFWLVVTFISFSMLVRELKHHKIILPNFASSIFLLFGLIYIFALCYARWTVHFNLFFYRSLDPGFSLIFIGIILWILQHGGHVKRITVIFLSISILIVGVTNSYLVYSGFSSGFTYNNNIQALNKKYSELPDKAIVLFGDDHLRYLKPNVRLIHSKKPPYSEFETFNELLSSLDSEADLYIDNGAIKQDLSRLHESFQLVLKNYPFDKDSVYKFK